MLALPSEHSLGQVGLAQCDALRGWIDRLERALSQCDGTNSHPPGHSSDYCLSPWARAVGTAIVRDGERLQHTLGTLRLRLQRSGPCPNLARLRDDLESHHELVDNLVSGWDLLLLD